MTDDEVLFHYQQMEQTFGDKLPNPEHQPIEFKYYVKLYNYFTRPAGRENPTPETGGV